MMTERRITEEMLEGFGRYLVNRERSSGTIDKYCGCEPSCQLDDIP